MKYNLTFIDDYTQFNVIYLLENKSEVLNYFKKYEAVVSVHFRQTIQSLRCDNGGEYISHNFKNFCAQKGIVVNYTAPYTPEQNGLAERTNRTIIESTRSLLFQSGLSKEMWSEAALMVTYLLNRLPTSKNSSKTPTEFWNGCKLNLSNIRVFGCATFAHIPKQLRSKLDSKLRKSVMLGFVESGYRLWDLETRAIFVSQDVIFNENRMQGNQNISKISEVNIREDEPEEDENYKEDESQEAENDRKDEHKEETKDIIMKIRRLEDNKTTQPKRKVT
ncbi:Integrase, catalytic core,Ribonuclease H-like domain [Cinara cedri]|uniref:Integrase, catalytic core,Ribonuclease H-like domain n=1 Tax=Cinara cedri TaxID=506608 RepID=A0A5E4MPX9_9HEMI|nr:Integrase, catalytic core,Ribonuclease H-like domain [Cinara cedri]